MSGSLENPLVDPARELTAKVSGGWTDGQWAAQLLIRETQAMVAPLRPDGRSEFLTNLADQIEEAARAAKETEVFELFARWLRSETAR